MGAKLLQNGLTVKEERMCQDYCFGDKSVIGNMTQCYVRYYNQDKLTKPNLSKRASLKFQENKIQERIEELMDKVSRGMIKQRIWQLANESKHDRDKIKALELLGKNLGMFQDGPSNNVNILGLVLPEKMA